MYSVEILTEPDYSEVLTVEELASHLRINIDSENDLLEGFILAAVDAFEFWAERPLLSTDFRQWETCWSNPIRLRKNRVSEVEKVGWYNTDDEDPTLDSPGESLEYVADLTGIPALIKINECLPALSCKRERPIYIEYTAGWNADEVPESVRLAVKLLASHYYHHRESFGENNLLEVPMGFMAICQRHRTGCEW